MIENIRSRFTAKTAALLLVFAFALTGTGISSLALLTDTVTTQVNASITTIELNANGVKNATIDLAEGAIPGDIRYASIVFQNNGTGYVNLPTTTAIVSGNGEFLADSQVEVWPSYGPNNTATGQTCDAAGITAAFGESTGTRAAKAISAQLYDNTVLGLRVEAHSPYDVCLRYRLGTAAAEYLDNISAFSVKYTFDAYYP